MVMIKGIVLAGVGGQGIITLGRILGEALISEFEVRVTEVHGLSQRGGSVMVQVKYGDEVLSPLIPLGSADALIGLELI